LPTTYPGSFLFWMDVIGTLSMAFEVSFLLGSSGDVQLVSLSANAAITRTARAGKLGARAARFLKIVKAMSTMATKSQDAEVDSIDKRSKLLSEPLAEKVSLLIVLVVCLLPIIHIERYPVEDFSMRAWAERLESSYAYNHDMLSFHQEPEASHTFRATVEATMNFYSDVEYFPFSMQGFNQHVTINGTAQSIPGESLIQGKPPIRREFIVQVTVPICEIIRPECPHRSMLQEWDMSAYHAPGTGGHGVRRAAIFFNFERAVKMEALMDTVTIVMVLAMMVYIFFDMNKNIAGIMSSSSALDGQALSARSGTPRSARNLTPRARRRK